MRFLLLSFGFLLATTLSAQEAKFQISSTFGLAGLNGNTLQQGAFTGASLDRIHPLNKKNSLFLGLGLQYSNSTVGVNDQPCVFPLGDKVITFTFSETYEFNPLEAVLRLGAQRRLGKLTVSGLLLPTLRLHDHITNIFAVDFDQIGRPNQFRVFQVRPDQAFEWSDGSTRKLRYNTAFQLRAGLELDFALTKQLALGLGYQAGLTKYELTNYFQDADPSGEETEFAVTTEDARTAQGYLLLRVRL